MNPNFSLFSRKYVCLYFDEVTNTNLREYCLQNGWDICTSFSGADIPSSEFDFHCTIIYSTEINTKPLPNGLFYLPEGKINIVPVDFDVFGEKSNCLVLKLLSTPSLLQVRNYIEGYGCADKWDEYRPHITLTYNYQGQAFPAPPSFPITVKSMKVEDIKE